MRIKGGAAIRLFIQSALTLPVFVAAPLAVDFFLSGFSSTLGGDSSREAWWLIRFGSGSCIGLTALFASILVTSLPGDQLGRTLAAVVILGLAIGTVTMLSTFNPFRSDSNMAVLYAVLGPVVVAVWNSISLGIGLVRRRPEARAT